MNIFERLMLSRLFAEAGEGGDAGGGAPQQQEGAPAAGDQQDGAPLLQPQQAQQPGQQPPQQQAPALVEKLPDAGDAKGWQELYSKLGRPEKIEDYGIAPPEGADGAFLNTALGWLHESGLNKQQAENIVSKWNDFNSEQLKIAQQNMAQQNDANRQEIIKSWGDKADANTAIVGNAVQRFFSDAAIEKLGKAGLLNDPDLVNSVLSIGTALGEDKTVTKTTNGLGGDSADIASRMWPSMTN